MLVLIPPSETKSDGGKGAPLDLGELSMPQLTETREMLVSALVDLAADTEASNLALGLGPKQADEIERNAKVWVSPTRPALERYTGVLFDALDAKSFTKVQREKAFRRLAMGSALFGAVRAGDPIPAYRLSGGSKLPGFGTLQSLWKPELTDALLSEADGGLVVDLRSGTYQQLGPVPDAAAWMTTKWLRSTDIVGGSWSAAIDVEAVKAGSDCLVNACSIYTIAAHGSSDRSQDTRTPITFAQPIVPAGPAVTVSKSTGLTNDEEITVTGTGFGRGGQGIYVALAQVDRYSNTDSAVFHSTKWIKPAQIVDGGFTTTLKATAIKGDANCYENACAIFTLADHNTLTDRSQDTQTPVTFAPPVVVPTPTVTANKTTNLVAGDTITVSGTGFQGAAAGTGIFITMGGGGVSAGW